MQCPQLFQLPLLFHEPLESRHIGRLQIQRALVDAVGFHSQYRILERLFFLFLCL